MQDPPKLAYELLDAGEFEAAYADTSIECFLELS